MIVAYEFYRRDSRKKYQLIGVLPEMKKSSVSLTQESIINWGRKILCKKIDSNDVFFIKITKEKNTGKILWLNSVYRPLKELRK